MNRITSIPSINFKEATIGIFWEFQESQFNRFIDPLIFGQSLIEVSRSFIHSSSLSKAQAFVGTNYDYCAGALSSLGFEVTIADNCFEQVTSAFIASILLWLWDCERSTESSENPVVFIVPSNSEIIPTLERLKSRNVQVIVAIDPLIADRTIWEGCSSFIIDVNDLGFKREEISYDLEPDRNSLLHRLENLQYLNITDSTTSTHNTFCDTTPQNLSLKYQAVENSTPIPNLGNSQHSSRSGGSSVLSMGTEINLKPEQKKQSTEHMMLQDELANAFRMKNVATAVSTLRKIYTKQSKTFRIETMLNNITQQNQFITNQQYQAASAPIYSEISFLLECIQWCFGAQKGDNVESFTYKMNKNIAKWLLKEIQKRELTPQLQQHLRPAVVSVCQSILRQVPEFELTLDMLLMVHISEPINVLLPYLSSWRDSLNPLVVQRVSSFTHEMGISLDGFHTDLPQRTSHQTYKQLGRQPSDPYHYHNQSKSTIQDEFRFGRRTEQEPYLTAGESVDMSLVYRRLLWILKNTPFGLLGSRILDIYAAEFGEPLQLHSQMLKDVLLGLEGVEMIGTDGPGDKMFCYVGSNT